MTDLVAIPTVEQINTEHQLAQSKAAEAVQHAINCGRMLLEVKASRAHGEWLPWLRAQQESGAISFSQQSASNYMRLAANYQRVGNLDKVPSIRAALELLSDNNPEQEQPELSGVEPEYPLAIAEPPSAQVVKTMLTALSSDDQWSIISSMWADLNAARTEQRRQERLEKLAAISRGNTELETDILSDHLRRSALEI